MTMAGLTPQLLLQLAAVLLIGFPFVVGGFVVLRSAQMRARGRERLFGAGGPVRRTGLPGHALDTVSNGVRRLGHRLALQDPSGLSAIRQRLIQAGFFNREAVTIYLAGRFAALAVATLGVMLLLPWAIAGGGGMGALAVAGILALGAMLGPDQVVRMRRNAVAAEYRDGDVVEV